MKPLAIDLFTGLHGWGEGLVAEGFRVVGFDLEDMCGQFGVARHPDIQLVIQDVLTLHGSQFKTAALIVASPPCQEYSYMAMPWSRAKQLAKDYESGVKDRAQLTALFDACFRIQREAIAAAGHHIPLVVENVRGAQKWVGRSRWNFGSFHLWGDVPALMPMVKARAKVGGIDFNGYGTPSYKGQAFNTTAEQRLRDGQKVPTDRICDCGHRESQHGFRPDEPCSECSCINPVWVSRRTALGTGARFTTDCDGMKNTGGSWFNIGSPGQKETNRNPVTALAAEGVKQRGSGREWFAGDGKISRMTSSKSPARKAASAMIAKIPFVLSSHIARVYKPEAAA